MSGLRSHRKTPSTPTSAPMVNEARSMLWASSGLVRLPLQPVAHCQRYPSDAPVSTARRRFRSESEMKVRRSMWTYLALS